MKVLVYRKCSTCMKALKWLDEHNINYEERAIKEENPTYEELKKWYAKSGLPLKKFFNTGGMIYKEMGLKDKLKDKLVFAKDVKEVLAWVQSGNADVGFVYFSDTVNNDKIKVVEKTDEKTHSPITYPVSVIKASKNVDAAKKFEEFLLSESGQKIFEEFGYKKVE